MKKYYYTFISIICLVSCTNKEVDLEHRDFSFEKGTLTILKDSNYLPHSVDEALPGNFGAYLKYFVPTDYEIGISSRIDENIIGRTISCISGPTEFQSNQTRSAGRRLSPIVSFVDGTKISQESLSQAKTRGGDNGILNAFGKIVTFSFQNGADTRSSEEPQGTAELYIPKEIEILAPSHNSEDELNPLCYYKDFILRWNEDDNNENDVLIAVEWYGGMVLGNDINDSHVRRIISFPDTGEALLPETLFEGIPDTAICHLTILRGNVDNVTFDQNTYKVLGETHQTIPFILLREVCRK